MRKSPSRNQANGSTAFRWHVGMKFSSTAAALAPTNYDSYARRQYTFSPHGAQTAWTYTYSPPTKTGTTTYSYAGNTITDPAAGTVTYMSDADNTVATDLAKKKRLHRRAKLFGAWIARSFAICPAPTVILYSPYMG